MTLHYVKAFMSGFVDSPCEYYTIMNYIQIIKRNGHVLLYTNLNNTLYIQLKRRNI